MSNNQEFAAPVRTMQDYVGRLEELAKRSEPTIFGLRARFADPGQSRYAGRRHRDYERGAQGLCLGW